MCVCVFVLGRGEKENKKLVGQKNKNNRQLFDLKPWH